MTAYVWTDPSPSPLPQRVGDRLRKQHLLTIASHIAAEYGSTVEEMLGRARHRAASQARQALWAHLYGLGRWSYPRLAALFERDHTTICAGVDRHLNRGEAPRWRRRRTV